MLHASHYSPNIAVLLLLLQVRLRVIATRVDASEIFAIGTIKDEYLGLITD